MVDAREHKNRQQPGGKSRSEHRAPRDHICGQPADRFTALPARMRPVIRPRGQPFRHLGASLCSLLTAGLLARADETPPPATANSRPATARLPGTRGQDPIKAGSSMTCVKASRYENELQAGGSIGPVYRRSSPRRTRRTQRRRWGDTPSASASTLATGAGESQALPLCRGGDTQLRTAAGASPVGNPSYDAARRANFFAVQMPNGHNCARKFSSTVRDEPRKTLESFWSGCSTQSLLHTNESFSAIYFALLH